MNRTTSEGLNLTHDLDLQGLSGTKHRKLSVKARKEPVYLLTRKRINIHEKKLIHDSYGNLSIWCRNSDSGSTNDAFSMAQFLLK